MWVVLLFRGRLERADVDEDAGLGKRAGTVKSRHGAEQAKCPGHALGTQAAERVAKKMPDMVDVVLSWQDSNFKIYIDLHDPAALFFTQVYLATSVWPPRQSITGFLASDGQVTISPLPPDANFKSMGIQKGMTLTLTQ